MGTALLSGTGVWVMSAGAEGTDEGATEGAVEGAAVGSVEGAELGAEVGDTEGVDDGRGPTDWGFWEFNPAPGLVNVAVEQPTRQQTAKAIPYFLFCRFMSHLLLQIPVVSVCASNENCFISSIPPLEWLLESDLESLVQSRWVSQPQYPVKGWPPPPNCCARKSVHWFKLRGFWLPETSEAILSLAGGL